MDLAALLTWFLSWTGLYSLSSLDSTNTVEIHNDVRLDIGDEARAVYPAGSILDVIHSAGATAFLAHAERCPWVLNELGNEPGYTVFVPTNQAFKKIPADIANAMNSSAQVIEWYLRYHMILDVIPSTGLTNDRLVPTAFKPPEAADRPVQLMRFNDFFVWEANQAQWHKVVTASGAPISKVDLAASNGVVHILDRVIYPIPTGADMARYLQEEPNYSSLYAALKAANLTSALSTPAFKPLTLLAPNNAAFASLTPAQQSLLKNATILQQVLTYHVVGKSVYSAAIYDNFQLTSLAGSTIYFEKGAGGVFAEGKQVVRIDTTVTNGVVHELTGVMFPPMLQRLVDEV